MTEKEQWENGLLCLNCALAYLNGAGESCKHKHRFYSVFEDKNGKKWMKQSFIPIAPPVLEKF